MAVSAFSAERHHQQAWWCTGHINTPEMIPPTTSNDSRGRASVIRQFRMGTCADSVVDSVGGQHPVVDVDYSAAFLNHVTFSNVNQTTELQIRRNADAPAPGPVDYSQIRGRGLQRPSVVHVNGESASVAAVVRPSERLRVMHNGGGWSLQIALAPQAIVVTSGDWIAKIAFVQSDRTRSPIPDLPGFEPAGRSALPQFLCPCHLSCTPDKQASPKARSAHHNYCSIYVYSRGAAMTVSRDDLTPLYMHASPSRG